MLRLADFSNDEGICYPGIEKIAREIGAGRSTVTTSIGELESDGWLTRKERRRGQLNDSNIYTLNVPKLKAAALSIESHRSVSDTSESDHSKSDMSGSERSDSDRSENTKKGGSHPSESGGDPSVNSKQDPSGRKPTCQPAAQTDPEVLITDQAKDVLKHLNLVTGSRYQTSKSSLENIRARLRDGYSNHDLCLVVDYKQEHWGDPTQPCTCCGNPSDDTHHIIGHGQGGMATKAHDFFTIPLCRKHHDDLHRDLSRWEEEYGSQIELWLKFIDWSLSIGAIQ
jgi:uncharacterized phage protein (TIGR02220 family)